MSLDFIRNFPFFSIVIAMFSGILCSVLDGKKARRFTVCILGIISMLSLALCIYINSQTESFVYMMGHFPAPWGNEIRAGMLEAMLSFIFSSILLFALAGGWENIFHDVTPAKQNYYFVMINLLMSSLLALIYTNDIFTAYVFVEINTIAACGLIMLRQNGHTIVAATRYLITSVVGSGLLLFGIIFLYSITGHLLFPNIHEELSKLYLQGTYSVPLTVVIGLIVVGLAIKSALFPFSAWVPDAYGYATTASGAILSGLVSKGYIVLLIKIFYRVIGTDIIKNSRVIDVLFVFGIAGMIMGSINAIAENDIRRMIAYSSVAQIGYIYMGIGMGTKAGMIAAVWHILSHAATKPLLFVSAAGLSAVSGESKRFHDLQGAAHRNPVAGIGFAIGALSMVGIPLFSGFISKILFATASVRLGQRMWITMFALAISTILNAMYFLRTVIRIYMPNNKEYNNSVKNQKAFVISVSFFVILNIVLGCSSQPVTDLILKGLLMLE